MIFCLLVAQAIKNAHFLLQYQQTRHEKCSLFICSHTQLKYHIILLPHLIGHTAKAQTKTKRTQNLYAVAIDNSPFHKIIIVLFNHTNTMQSTLIVQFSISPCASPIYRPRNEHTFNQFNDEFLQHTLKLHPSNSSQPYSIADWLKIENSEIRLQCKQKPPTSTT